MHVCVTCVCFIFTEWNWFGNTCHWDTDEKLEERCYFNLRLSAMVSLWKNLGHIINSEYGFKGVISCYWKAMEY